MKRIISFIMAAVMVVMMLPAVVGAESTVVEVLYDDEIKGFPGESPDKLFDKNISTKWCAEITGIIAEIRWAESEAITATGYAITTANDTAEFAQRNPDRWELYGWSVETGFVKLDVSENPEILEAVNFTTYTFSIDEQVRGAYDKYMLKVWNNDERCVQLAEVALITDEEVTDSVHNCVASDVVKHYGTIFHCYYCEKEYCSAVIAEEHIYGETVRNGYKNETICTVCGYTKVTPLTQGQEAVDNIKNVMKTLSLRKFAVAIDCDEDAVVITNNTNTKKVIDDLGDSALYNFMADVKYSFAAREGYKIVSVTVDGVEVDADDVLIYQIKGNHVIKVVTEEIVVEEAADTAIAE